MPAALAVCVEVHDALGRRIWTDTEVRPSGAGRLALDLGGLPAGVYVARVTAGAEAARRRVVVAH